MMRIRFWPNRLLIVTLGALSLAACFGGKKVPPLGRWRRLELGRAELMRAELERIVATPGLSKDVFEQVSKSLG